MITFATRRALQQPVERDLRDRLAGLGGDLVQGVDDPEQVLVVDSAGRCPGCRVRACRGSGRLAAADLAGEPAPAERAPDHRADALVERQRHQLPFVIAAEQRVIGLVRDVARKAVALRDRERLHQVPAGEVRAADVADLARAHQLVERGQRLLDRRVGVEAVQLEEVDVVGAEAPQRPPRPPRSGAGETSRSRWARRPSETWPWWRSAPGRACP